MIGQERICGTSVAADTAHCYAADTVAVIDSDTGTMLILTLTPILTPTPALMSSIIINKGA